jgi:hypothetical protein
VTWAVDDERSKKRVFPSSQRLRITSMMKEFAVFLSAAANRATAAGHHSLIPAFLEGMIFRSWKRITAPIEMSIVKGH